MFVLGFHTQTVRMAFDKLAFAKSDAAALISPAINSTMKPVSGERHFDKNDRLVVSEESRRQHPIRQARQASLSKERECAFNKLKRCRVRVVESVTRSISRAPSTPQGAGACFPISIVTGRA